MTKNPLSFLFAGFRYLLHCFSAGRLFDRCRFGRLLSFKAENRQNQ